MTKKILLVGPYPPPYHGTSIPLELLNNYILEKELGHSLVLSTLTREGLSILHPKVIFSYITTLFQFVRILPQVDLVLITGSQGFLSSVGSLMVFLSRRVFNKKTSIYVHGGGFDRYYDGLSRWARKVVNKTFRSADNFIVQTRHLGNRFSADFQNIAVVPNWTKIPGEFHPDVKKRRSSAQSKLDQVRFVFCGEVRAEKGIQELFLGFQNAADKLRQKDIYISLDIFGQINSTFQETFNRLLEEFKSAGVIYNGYLTHPELMERLPQFDVLVLPTYLPTEGYPGVIIEGMSFGLPVIASRWRALPELVIEGRNGLLIEPQNHADLAEKMMEIARDDQLRSFLGSNAREEALNYDVNTVLPDLCKLIGLFEYKV